MQFEIGNQTTAMQRCGYIGICSVILLFAVAFSSFNCQVPTILGLNPIDVIFRELQQ